MRNVMPFFVGIAAAATLIAAGWLPSTDAAQALPSVDQQVTPASPAPSASGTPKGVAAPGEEGPKSQATGAATPTPDATPTPTPTELPEPTKPGDPTPESSVEPLSSPAAPAPSISDAERRASNTEHKDPARKLETCEVRMSAVGASFTQANSESSGTRADGTWLREGDLGNGSWAYWADADDNVVVDGGWALGGSETGDIVQRVERSWFPVDTNLVILLGTNNLLHGSSIEAASADIERIARTSGLAPENIYVVQLPPSNITPDGIGPYNEMLAQTARANGYHVVDVSTFLDDGTGRYKDGATTDGIHLTQANARRVGQTIAANINANAGCRTIPEFEEFAADNDLGKALAPPNCDFPDGRCEQTFEGGTLVRSNTVDAQLKKD